MPIIGFVQGENATSVVEECVQPKLAYKALLQPRVSSVYSFTMVFAK